MSGTYYGIYYSLKLIRLIHALRSFLRAASSSEDSRVRKSKVVLGSFIRVERVVCRWAVVTVK